MAKAKKISVSELVVGNWYRFQLRHGPMWHGEEQTEYVTGQVKSLDWPKPGIITLWAGHHRFFRPERVVSVKKAAAPRERKR